MSAAATIVQVALPITSAGTTLPLENPTPAKTISITSDIWQAPRLEKEKVAGKELTFQQRSVWEEQKAIPYGGVPTMKPVRIESAVKPLLRGNTRYLFDRLLAISKTKAFASGLTIESIRVYLFKDPEEYTTKKVLEITVCAGPLQAMACWEATGHAIDLWRGGLPPHLKEKLVSEWSLRVHWTRNGQE